MDARTLEALNASIAKWERNAEAETPDEYLISAGDCPLCHLFYNDYCEDCPVAARTGKNVCRNTPYYDAVDARYAWILARIDGDEDKVTAAREDSQENARAEVAFLKSLLPTGAP